MLTARRCAVVGHPVAHSLSPPMHAAAYAHLGLDWDYTAIDVEPGGLAHFVATRDASWRGLSVTAPHKRDALDLADSASEMARRAGGANTLLLDARGVHADNTDVGGTANAWREHGLRDLTTVRVLGAGATAASVALAARELGARRLELRVRDATRAEQTRAAAAAAGLDVRIEPLAQDPSEHADLIVSTLPEHVVAPQAAAHVARADAVFEVVYDPWPTTLARLAQEAGRPVVDGLDLLAHQAVLQVRLMTEHEVPVEILRSAARAALG